MGFLSDVEKHLDLPPGPKSEVMRELTSHYQEMREELIASGLPEAQLDEEAERRLGSPVDVAARLSAVHNSASWRSAVLCAVPFLLSAVTVWLYTANFGGQIRLIWLSLVLVITALASVREIFAGRRPVWLATWLAAALLAAKDLNTTIHLVAYAGNAELLIDKRADIVAGLGLTLLMLMAAWRFRLGRRAVLVVAAAYTACAVAVLAAGPTETSSAAPVLVGLLLIPVMLVLFARRIFDWHPYGNAVQTALFVFAVLGLRFLPDARLYAPVFLMLGCILCGLVVLWLTRIPAKKHRALLLAIAVWSVLVVLAEGPYGSHTATVSIADYAFAAIAEFGKLAWIAFLPIWQQNTRGRDSDPLQIAQ